MNQPIPTITPADLNRIVHRDFLRSQWNDVWVVLDSYGSESDQPDANRVHMAALKCAEGDIAKLSASIDAACKDFRNVLASAEYPFCSALPAEEHETMPDAELAKIYEQDRAQYQAWLDRA
jgi:hypothetical protein